jgi:hypothetical protein
MERARPPHAERVHRRRVLARAGKASTDIASVLSAEEKDRRRLGEVEKNLLDNGLPPQERVTLAVERIWLRFRLEKISTDQKTSELQNFLNQLNKEDPSLYDWLTEEEEGVSRLVEIRNRVCPPQRVGGYYTKNTKR